MDWLQARGSLIANNHLAPLANVVRHMETIEGLTDTDLTEVHQSKQLFGTVAESSRPLNALLSLVKADDLMGVLETNVKRPRETAAAIRADGDKRIAAMPEKTDKEKGCQGQGNRTDRPRRHPRRRGRAQVRSGRSIEAGVRRQLRRPEPYRQRRSSDHGRR
jgi:hypothetical protein